MTLGGARCGGLSSQTKICFQPRAARPAIWGRKLKSHERFFSKPGNKAAVNISTEGDLSGKIFFLNNKNNIKFSNSLFLKENGLKVLVGVEGKKEREKKPKRGWSPPSHYLSRTSFFWSSPHKKSDAISCLVPIFPVR